MVGSGNVIYSITFGPGSIIKFTNLSSVIIEGDVDLPAGSEFDLLAAANVVVNGHFSVSGEFLMRHQSVLDVKDTLEMLSGSAAYFFGESTIKAQDLIMQTGSQLLGDARSHYNAATGLGFPTAVQRGGTHGSTDRGSSKRVLAWDYYGVAKPTAHGSVRSPRHAGSPGSHETTAGVVGGKGGSAILIEVVNRMTLDGEISSNGGDRTTGGAGAGGSIDLNARVLMKSSGVIRANGGVSTIPGGGGGGGRIAIKCDYSEFVDESHATKPLGLIVQADGKGQGPGTIWYDCGTMRATLVMGADFVSGSASNAYVDVAEFQDVMIRDIRIGNTYLYFTTELSRSGDEFALRYGTLQISMFALAAYFEGSIYPRSHPDPSNEACFDYVIRSGCAPHQDKYAVYDESIDTYGTTTAYFPEITVVNGALGGEVTYIEGTHLIWGIDSYPSSITAETFHLLPGVNLMLNGPLTVTDTLILEGEMTMYVAHPAINTKNFYMGPNSLIVALDTSLGKYGCDRRVVSFAGCYSGNNPNDGNFFDDCLANPSTKPYGLFYDVKEKGATYADSSSCSYPGVMNALLHITITGKTSIAGKISTQVQYPGVTGGALRMNLNEVVHMSGTIDISGGDGLGSLLWGSSAGRAMITCKSDPFNSMFHLKVKANGGCHGGQCAATGSVYLDCGYFTNYLKVVSPGLASVPAPTHIIIDRDFFLDTIEVSDKGNLYFTAVNNNFYKFEVKTIISPTPPRVEKASNIRLKLGQAQPPALPAAATINALTATYQTLSSQKRTNLGNLMAQVDAKYDEQLALLWDVHNKSVELNYCRNRLTLCQADECSGESTRFTRTGRSTVGIKMNVETFKNPLDVKTAHETLRDTLSNFYDIPKSDILMSDPVESGTRVMNVTVLVDTDVANQAKRILLEKSSRIDDSPVESCFKRVNL